jgi:hypothetical protein
VVCILLICACNKQKENDTGIDHIDIDSSDQINFSNLFDEFYLIFPESKDSSFFGLDILRIEKYEDRLYLLNQKQSSKDILCFDTNGRFLFSINKIGRGPGEYTFLNYFFIDKQISNLILSVERNEWLYFDLDGHYLHSKILPQEVPIDRYTCEFNDSLYVIFRDEGYNDEYKDIVFLDRFTLQVKQSLAFTDPLLANFVPALPITSDQGIFYYYSGNDIIYDISSDIGSKIPVYTVDFGRKQRKFKSTFSADNNDEYIHLFTNAFQKKEVRFTRGFFYNKKYIVINYVEFDSDSQQQVGAISLYQTVFYDKHTKKSYNTNHINFDIFNSVAIRKMTVLGYFDGYFYAVINDSFSRENINKMAKSKYLSEEDKKKLLKMDDMSNPIIMVFK